MSLKTYTPDTTPRIFRFLENIDIGRAPNPVLLDYTILEKLGLHRRVVAKPGGEYRLIEWFEDDTETVLILDVRYAYERSANGLVLWRWCHRRWYGEGGTVVAERWKKKKYSHDPEEQAEEGNRRRGNVLRNLEVTVLGLLIQFETGGDSDAAEDLGIPYLEKYSTELTNYRRSGKLTVLTAGISGDIETWLDTYIDPPTNTTTIRMVILSKLIEIVDVPDESWTAEVKAGPPG